MMNDSLRGLVKLYWVNLRKKPFSEEVLLKRLSVDGGLDAKDLTKQIIADLLDKKLTTNWSTVIFSCSELVAFYLALENDISPEQIVGAVFAACVLADAARAGKGDWSLEHCKVVRLCGIVSEKVPTELSLTLMSYLFGKRKQNLFC